MWEVLKEEEKEKDYRNLEEGFSERFERAAEQEQKCIIGFEHLPLIFLGTLPQPLNDHAAVNIEKSKIVVFGGLVDKRFINNLCVYDIENK